MTTVQKRRLLKLAKHLETRARSENFDLTSVTNAKQKKFCKNLLQELKKITEPKCGATACAIGFCPVFFPSYFKWQPYEEYDYNIMDYTITNYDVMYIPSGTDAFYANDACTEFFGLDRVNFDWIFQQRPGYKTAKQVAERIRFVVQRYEDLIEEEANV